MRNQAPLTLPDSAWHLAVTLEGRSRHEWGRLIEEWMDAHPHIGVIAPFTSKALEYVDAMAMAGEPGARAVVGAQ